MSLVTFILVVGLAERDAHCEPRMVACYDRETNTAYMRGYYDLPEGKYQIAIPKDMKFPSWSSSNGYGLRTCGWKIQEQNGMQRSGRAAEYLCHEAKHAFFEATGNCRTAHHRCSNE